ncbi:hypothetical protein OH77DRAFT_1555004, partial [Trametes cingulata]
ISKTVAPKILEINFLKTGVAAVATSRSNQADKIAGIHPMVKSKVSHTHAPLRITSTNGANNDYDEYDVSYYDGSVYSSPVKTQDEDTGTNKEVIWSQMICNENVVLLSSQHNQDVNEEEQTLGSKSDMEDEGSMEMPPPNPLALKVQQKKIKDKQQLDSQEQMETNKQSDELEERLAEQKTVAVHHQKEDECNTKYKKPRVVPEIDIQATKRALAARASHPYLERFYLSYNREHKFIICNECRIGVEPALVKTHVKTRHGFSNCNIKDNKLHAAIIECDIQPTLPQIPICQPIPPLGL